jgi:hypothetical protein
VDAWNAGRATISVVVIILFVAYLCEKAVWPILGYAISALDMRNLDVGVISWPDRELVGVLFFPLVIPIISTVNQRWNGFAGFYVQICTTSDKVFDAFFDIHDPILFIIEMVFQDLEHRLCIYRVEFRFENPSVSFIAFESP